MNDELAEREQVRASLAQLGDLATELGILAENAFKEAAEALFGQESALTESVRGGRQAAISMYVTIHEQALYLLAHSQAPGESVRRVIELQQTAAEFQRIAGHAWQIAAYALDLRISAELALQRAGCADPAILRRIVRQTYLQVRGAVIVCATRDTARARLLAREDDTLDQLYATLRSMLHSAIAAAPLHAFPLHHIILVGAEMEAIGNRAVAICNAVLVPAPRAR
ncbi:MAG: phosphate uptake regulator PhoU [Ktedonobacterales bacterium]|nr:phosphate uptake regulator PhoU [Ktedonobacterales bacterium]